MNDEAAFLDALRAESTDATVLLVYADWLEERGDLRAEYIRLTQAPQGKEARIEELGRQFDPEWVVLIDDSAQEAKNTRVWAELVEMDREWQRERGRLLQPTLIEVSILGEESPGIFVTFLPWAVSLALLVWPLWVILDGLLSGEFVGEYLVSAAFCVFFSGMFLKIGFHHHRYLRAWHTHQERRTQTIAHARPLPPA